MRTIRISEEVWDEIAKRGVFGETPDIVLRRIFGLDKSTDKHLKLNKIPPSKPEKKIDMLPTD